MNISRMNNITIISDNGVSNITQINGTSKVNVNGGLIIFKSNTTSPITIRINNKFAEVDGDGLEIVKIKGLEIKNKGYEQNNNQSEQKDIKLNKPKMSAPRKKRLIAQMVVGLCAAGFITSTSLAFVYGAKADNAMNCINSYNHEKESILSTYRTSHEFQQEFKLEVQKSTDLYMNNLLSYDEYTNRLKHLNSQQFVESVLHKSSKQELQNKVNTINTQIDTLNQDWDKNSKISIGAISGMIGSGLSCITPAALLGSSLSKDNVCQ